MKSDLFNCGATEKLRRQRSKKGRHVVTTSQYLTLQPHPICGCDVSNANSLLQSVTIPRTANDKSSRQPQTSPAPSDTSGRNQARDTLTTIMSQSQACTSVPVFRQGQVEQSPSLLDLMSAGRSAIAPAPLGRVPMISRINRRQQLAAALQEALDLVADFPLASQAQEPADHQNE